MTIQHALLGLLRAKPLAGYDMKKAIQRSPLLYWSGNNNQIYRALAELEALGLIQSHLQHGDAGPTKKIYTLTGGGLAELRRLSLGLPEAPELRKPFLMQLVFGGDLTRPELEQLLEQYRREVYGAALAIKHEALSEDATPYEATIHALATDNLRQSFEAELAWIERVRTEALPLAPEASAAQEDHDELITQYVEDKRFVQILSGQLRSERDALALVSACVEHGANRVLLPAASLSNAFLRLGTGVAGYALQKLEGYNIRAAAVLDVTKLPGTLRDFLLEASHGTTFRAFAEAEQAEKWLSEQN